MSQQLVTGIWRGYIISRIPWLNNKRPKFCKQPILSIHNAHCDKHSKNNSNYIHYQLYFIKQLRQQYNTIQNQHNKELDAVRYKTNFLMLVNIQSCAFISCPWHPINVATWVARILYLNSWHPQYLPLKPTVFISVGNLLSACTYIVVVVMKVETPISHDFYKKYCTGTRTEPFSCRNKASHHLPFLWMTLLISKDSKGASRIYSWFWYAVSNFQK